jgi:hypothetical protein
MMPAQPDRNQVIQEARAKIIWGDEPETVVRYLQINGLGYDEAWDHVDAMLRERAASIRGCGIRKLLAGIPLLLVPAVAILIIPRVGIMSLTLLTILGVAVTIGLWGAWKCFKGISMLLFPNSEAGDIADQSD